MSITLDHVFSGKSAIYGICKPANFQMRLFEADKAALDRHPRCDVFLRDSPPGESPLFDAMRASGLNDIRYLVAVFRGQNGEPHSMTPVAQNGLLRLAFSQAPHPAHDAPHIMDLDTTLITHEPQRAADQSRAQ